ISWKYKFSTHLFIECIDKLHAVILADSGMFLKTTDAGNTWQKINTGITSTFATTHFSDSLNGIALVRTNNPSNTIFTTKNGGLHWDSITTDFAGLRLTSCHSYGKGKYRVFQQNDGVVYTTKDNWKTVVKSALPSDALTDTTLNPGQLVFINCNFQGQDTI